MKDDVEEDKIAGFLDRRKSCHRALVARKELVT